MSFARLKRIAGALLLIAVIVTAAAPRLALGEPQEIDQRIDELNNLQSEIDALEKELASKTSAEKSVLAELTKLENELSLAEKELSYIQIQLSITDEKLTQTKADIAVMEEKLASQQEALDTRLVSMYKAGRISYIDVLLNSTSLSELLARVHYLKDITVQDTALIEEYSQTRSELLQKQTDLEEYTTNLLSLQATQETKRSEVTSRSKDRETYLASIQSDKDRLAESLDEMNQEAAALNKVIADLQAQGQKPQAHPLKMIWPATGGWISSYFGNRFHPILGYYKYHSGIDYAINTGTPEKAAEDGTIIFAGVNGGYGNCVIIDHGGGISTLYGHGSQILVSVGQDVIQGQTVMLAGATGLATGPHLHFEVRVNGECVDPLDWLP